MALNGVMACIISLAHIGKPAFQHITASICVPVVVLHTYCDIVGDPNMAETTVGSGKYIIFSFNNRQLI